MPDHIHFFCTPAIYGYPPLRDWVKYWKMLVTRSWPYQEEKPIWQLDFWDVQIRKSKHYSEKYRYIANNPVRKGLVKVFNEWPYQGELNKLLWLSD